MPKKPHETPRITPNTDPVATKHHFEHVRHYLLVFKLSCDLKGTQIRPFYTLSNIQSAPVRCSLVPVHKNSALVRSQCKKSAHWTGLDWTGHGRFRSARFPTRTIEIIASTGPQPPPSPAPSPAWEVLSCRSPTTEALQKERSCSDCLPSRFS